jgi:hypothetical protein
MTQAPRRQRSPNYPSLSLKEAVEKVRSLHDKNAQHPMTRDVAAKSMGYSGLSGPSATAISALNKYGLLTGRGDEIRVSDRAMAILYAHSDEERRHALNEAFLEPDLFRELAQKFPGKLPSDDALKSFLIRNKFAHSAVTNVISCYKETVEFAVGVHTPYDSSSPMMRDEDSRMHNQPAASAAQTPIHYANVQTQRPIYGDERSIGRYDFEGGGSLVIAVSGNVTTEKALKMAETLIRLKREELMALTEFGSSDQREAMDETEDDISA